MDNDFGFKELYEVALKTTYPIEIQNRTLQPGEVIAYFDRLQLGNFKESKKFASSNGGYDNRSLVWWEETNDVKFSLVQGVFSKVQFALMSNSKLISSSPESAILLTQRELLESDESGIITLKHKPVGAYFIYETSSGDKLEPVAANDINIQISRQFTNVVVDYQWEYAGKFSSVVVGRSLVEGYLTLEGKTRVKDDITGQVKTGILTIPKLKLMSDLSMRLGSDAVPVVGQLDAVALPVGAKGQKKVMEITFLDDDIDSDM